ncbi:Sec23/Sec24 family protein [Purpureocillium lilacinum]|uniref:Sec23/Sec24 family protein n=1 Tax=Purpureocillium lilacinum TaxID=33203 RepID=A0A179HRI8_PURLI|nr:Sec23/Sec24 family protein [Purpureocillium lilacinum]OAQ92644.1 Sec23/Sec24 family protein [Purpureocillium lilacinum]GJN82957.1 COPII coat Sec23p-Sfb3p heterodimer component [Purpureocillium lilacinum]
MADYTQYHALGQGMGNDPNDPNRNNPYAAPGQAPYQQQQQQQQPPPAGYGAPPYAGQPQSPPVGGYGAPQGQGFQPGIPQPGDDALAAQMGGMNLGDGHSTIRKKKKDRHAYHTVEPTGSSQAFNGMPPPGSAANQFIPTAAAPAGPGFGGQFGSPQGTPQTMSPNQFPVPAGAQFSPPGPGGFGAGNGSADAAATIAPTGQSKISPDDMPSVPLSRDAVQEHFLKNVYPTFERHVPPPATVSFVAFDQGNASPKYARLTMNNIPATADGLHATGLPLGLMLQPLAPLQAGEAEIPVLDFGDSGPPRCRRCRAYINPFMMFRSGGNKFVCNLCTHPNDTPPEYFCATSPQGVRLDRDQRPELHRGTVEFVVPKEYWTREPVGLRWLFVIDATQESYNKGFMETFCDGILAALYGGEDQEKDDNGEPKRRIPEGAKVGFITYDKDIHFYNLNPRLDQAQMLIMPDLEDPFLPLGEGLFVDPYECKALISSLLTRLPDMFSTVKNPEPALLATLNSAFAALEKTGGKIVCSCSALPTWGPGRLFMRDDGNHPGGEMDKKLYTTEHPGWKKVAEKMAASGVGADFFLAAPSGGYLDIATIGHVAATTGGETFYYPNFIAPRDGPKLSAEISHTVTRETGFQALMKVRCSNGLQVAAYHGNFVQHTFGADLEIGAIDADKALGVSFSYDGKLDSKLDAHFQSALLYTTASGQRRVRCSNVIASVSETAKEAGVREKSIRGCMKFVDQDAVVGILAKEASTKLATTSSNLKDVRNWLSERAIDIMACYRKHSAQQHPPGQLVMPERLKEFCMYVLGLIKSRAFKGGVENSDRRVHEMRMVRSMGALELSLYLYPRIFPIHNLQPEDGFADAETGHLKMPPAIRASFSRVEPGGVYLVDNGQQCLLWFHEQTSPNLVSDLFGEGKDSLKSLDAYTSSLPVLETHLNCQVRNIIEFLKTMRGSKGLTIQLARRGIDGAEYEFARMLVEDRNNEAQSYVDWLVHVHKGVQLELSGQRKKETEGDAASQALANFTGLRPAYW